MPLTLILNGRNERFETLADGASLADAIGALALKPDRVAVERNGEIVARSVWSDVRLAEGDKLEVVHFVGGGI